LITDAIVSKEITHTYFCDFIDDAAFKSLAPYSMDSEVIPSAPLIILLTSSILPF
jgi:hypothetical protein